MNPPHVAPTTGFDPAALAQQVTAAADLVKALIASGQITLETLGLVPAAAGAGVPSRDLVPGERIKVHDLVVKTMAGLSEGSKRTYGTYLHFIDQGWPATAPAEEKLFAGFGDEWFDEVLPSDLEAALRMVTARTLLGAHRKAERREAAGRVVRDSDASGAGYNAVGAWRAMGKVAVKDRHLAKGFDPTQEITKPKRGNGDRPALEQDEMDELWEVVTGTGDDVELDRLLVETILIAGARVEGTLNMTLGGIDLDDCTLLLDEKFGKKVHQPVPDWFAAKVHAFAVSRGAKRRDDKVFVYRPGGRRRGAPITIRRFNYIFTNRVQAMLPWADKQQVTAHTLRHHAISVVERRFSKAVSLAFARHEPEDVNDRYSKASKEEVAQAVVALYGGGHPWVG